MRIRLPFAGTFFLLLLLAGYAGLSSLQLGGLVDDKLLHVVTFFALTVAFYWIVDTSRRRTLNLSLLVCTVGLGIGSELLQASLPDNGRVFDLLDIAANVVGSLAALGLCSWYHKRMLERKRHQRYAAVPGGAGDDDDPGAGDAGLFVGVGDVDIELGQGVGVPRTVLHDGDHEHDHDHDDAATTPTTTLATPPSTAPSATSAVVGPAGNPVPAAAAPPHRSLEEELDNWDENAEDPWEGEDDTGDMGAATGAGGGPKKRTDKDD
ncbi:vanz-like protein [Niveomyces insectorum RCEF 264]|uniref:Vanz-like protein n=1 Tax=Niveomyces insectorum RCEF 264 TaxID=1081102 RepID=A0A167S4I1_9HYPO|nr:vanz-like protein [Niveomyces insectorum RCEF 264]